MTMTKAGKDHSRDYVGRGNKKIKKEKNRHRDPVIVICA